MTGLIQPSTCSNKIRYSISKGGMLTVTVIEVVRLGYRALPPANWRKRKEQRRIFFS